MDNLIENLYSLPFKILIPPQLRIIKPKWLRLPSSRIVFIIFMFSYFLICAGIVYDIIVEPPAMGSATDSRGAVRPVAFMQHRINGQYIVEGLAASLFFVLGSIGFIIMEQSDPNEVYDKEKPVPRAQNSSYFSSSSSSKSSEQNVFLVTIAFMLIMISFAICWLFMITKLP